MVEDRNGFDPFMYACYYGRNSNIKFWLEQFKKWDIHRGNRATGANALTLALNQGPRKLETVKMLMEAGFDITRNASSGVTNLMAACPNEDADPDVVELLLTAFMHSKCSCKTTRSSMDYDSILCKDNDKMKFTKSDGLVKHIAKGLEHSVALRCSTR